MTISVKQTRRPALDATGAGTRQRNQPILNTIDPRVRRALELVDSTPALSISQIAAAVNLSVSRLRHLFRSQLGITPARYVKRVRLEHARELLESSFLRVKEVAAVVGVNDLSHFVRDYKARYLHTPSEARGCSLDDHPRR
jgi:AraC family transcriptional regulator, arabinose operon regulatory protein